MKQTLVTSGGRMKIGRSAAPLGVKAERVHQWLAGQIAAGVYRRNHRLPTESELMARFGVSRVTVRHALDDLRRSGVIEGRQGKGYFVRRLRAVQDLTRLQGFGEMMASLGVETRSTVLDVAEIKASAEVAAALDIARGDLVTRVKRVRLAGGTPFSHDVSHFPLDIGRRLSTLDLPGTDIFRLLEETLGVELGYADLLLELVPGERDVATHLEMQPDEPVIRIVRLTRDLDGRPIDFEYIYGRPDAFQFCVRVPRW